MADPTKEQDISDHTNVECPKCGCWRWGYIGEGCRSEGCDGIMCKKAPLTSKKSLSEQVYDLRRKHDNDFRDYGQGYKQAIADVIRLLPVETLDQRYRKVLETIKTCPHWTDLPGGHIHGYAGDCGACLAKEALEDSPVEPKANVSELASSIADKTYTYMGEQPESSTVRDAVIAAVTDVLTARRAKQHGEHS